MNPSYSCNNELAMAWINLSYARSSLFSRKPKPILVSLNGQINFYSLTALMGPSGAGKTTLLKCINMRNNNGLTDDTKLFVNKYTKLKTCFIMQNQNEHLLMGLTVRESLLFASKIKNRLSSEVRYRNSYTQTGASLLSIPLGESTSENSCHSLNDYEPIDKNGNFDHNRNINKILSELLLEDCSDNLVNNCSGGEQKRLSIGLELVAKNKPNLLCIDEPTSGLDSNAAELVIQCLSQLSHKHQMSIVTSIHQPNSLLLAMFDQLYVVAKGGHCVFSGPPNQLKSHLLECGITCPQDVLPIEVLLKISSKQTKITNNTFKTIPKIKIQCDSEDSVESDVLPSDEIDRLIETSYRKSSGIISECKLSGKQAVKISIKEKHFFNFYHFYYLLLREFTCLIRYQWRASAALTIFSLMIALLLKYLYGSDIGQDNGCLNIITSNQTPAMRTSLADALEMFSQESKVTLNLKCQFFAVAFLQFVSMACTILVFPSEVKVFLNEHHNNWYSTSSYYWSKYIIEIPIAIVISYIYSFIIYYGTGQLSQNWRFAYFAFISSSGMIIANSLGYFIGIIFAHNFQVATTSGVAVFLVLVLMSGFFVPLSTLNVVLRGASYLSFIKLTFESILITIYGFERCSGSQIPLLLHQLDLSDDQLPSHLLWIIGHLTVWRIIALITLIYRANDFNLTLRWKPKFNLVDLIQENSKITMVANYLNYQTPDSSFSSVQ